MALVAQQPVAVVELFTSEGCSSCPPADRLLAELVTAKTTEGRRVVALGYHVDYWDRLGWPDALARSEWTARQERYARVFAGRGMYTPQLVVNGATQCVGSDAQGARALIKDADAALPVMVQVRRDGARVVVTGTARAPGQELVVVIVEDGVVRKIGRGENGGATLRHEHAVRALSSSTIDANGAATVSVPMVKPIGTGPLSIVAFVQDKTTMKIRGAVEAALP